MDIVQELLPKSNVYYSEDGFDLMNNHIKSDIIISWGDMKFLNEQYCLYCADVLKWIHCLSAGVEGIMESEVVKIPGIRITNSRGIHGVPISEHVMGYLIAHFRDLPRIHAFQKKEEWHRFIPDELCGKVVGILGVGMIGKEIASKCKAFHTTVYGVKKTYRRSGKC